MSDSREPVDLVLVTGFLGAGKTTLVNRLAKSLASGDLSSELRRTSDTVEDGRPPLGLLINDFGRVVVDGALIKEESADLQVFEVADGSIFCSCKTASFVAGLRMFARVRPQTLIVEASGMSDPSGLSKILSENRISDSYRVRRIVCLVDATRFLKLYGTLTAVERQVAGADLILINKTDLADAAAITALEQTLRAINSEAVIERTSYADINPTLLRTDLSRELLGDVVSCSTPETRPAAMQLVAGLHSREEIAAALSDLLPLAYRIKGWAAGVEGWWYISDNADQIEWKSTDSASVPAEGITVICAPEHAAEIAQLWRDSGVERE